jgi:hypothetical protein
VKHDQKFNLPLRSLTGWLDTQQKFYLLEKATVRYAACTKKFQKINCCKKLVSYSLARTFVSQEMLVFTYTLIVAVILGAVT